MGWPPRRPRKSQRACWLVAVVRLSRWSMCCSSRLTKGSRTGEGEREKLGDGKLRPQLTCGSVLAGWVESGAPPRISIAALDLDRRY